MAQPIYQPSISPIVSSGIGVEKILDERIIINPDEYVDLDFDKAIQTKELDIIYIYVDSDNLSLLAFSLIRELETGIIQEQIFFLYNNLNYFTKQMGIFQFPRGFGINLFALTNTQYYKLRIYNQDTLNPITLTIKIWLERQL
jgi:hypothetical protein